jgi:hypothetical protein
LPGETKPSKTLAAYGQATLRSIASLYRIFLIMSGIVKWTDQDAERIVGNFTFLRMALVLETIDKPIPGGAAPRAAPTLRQRGPPTLLTGLGGRLPNWTLSTLLPTCKYMLTTPGICCANGPAARRAAAAMAMAHTEATQAARLAANKSELEEDTTDNQGTGFMDTDLATTSTTKGVTGAKGIIVSFTPLHPWGLEVATGTYGVVVLGPTWAFRVAAGN